MSSMENETSREEQYEVSAQIETERNPTIFEKMYAGAVDQEASSGLFLRGTQLIEDGLRTLPLEHLGRFNKRYDLMKADLLADLPEEQEIAIYNQYLMLRESGFTHGEVSALIEATHQGALSEELLRGVTHEQENIGRMINASREDIEKCDQALDAVFAGDGMRHPTVFMGPYQSLVHFSSINGELSPSSSSMYAAGEDTVLLSVALNFGQEENRGLSPRELTTYVHEHTHRNASKQVTKGEDYVPFAELTAVHIQSGFSSFGCEDPDPTYVYVNEGVTEYFARKAIALTGIVENETRYDEETVSIKVLMEFLAKESGTTFIDEEETMRGAYIHDDERESVKSRVEEVVGAIAFDICNALFIYPDMLQKFLELALQQKNGVHVGEELWISESAVKHRTPKLDPAALKRTYPFMRIGGQVFDEATGARVWKTSEELKTMYPK